MHVRIFVCAWARLTLFFFFMNEIAIVASYFLNAETLIQPVATYKTRQFSGKIDFSEKSSRKYAATSALLSTNWRKGTIGSIEQGSVQRYASRVTVTAKYDTRMYCINDCPNKKKEKKGKNYPVDCWCLHNSDS